MSSRNCDWKTASRSTRRIKAELPSQLLQRQPPPPALTSLTERCRQPPRISWRTEQVRGLHQSSQFIGGNQGNVLCATTANNHHFVIIGNLVQDRSQPFSQTRICCLHWHNKLDPQNTVQHSCTYCPAVSCVLAGCSFALGAHFQHQRAGESRRAKSNGHRNGHVFVGVGHVNVAALNHAINNGAHDTQEQSRSHARGGEQQCGEQHPDRRGEDDGGFAALRASGDER